MRTTLNKYRKITTIVLLFNLYLSSAQQIKSFGLSQAISCDGIFVSDNGNIYAAEGWDGDKVFEISPKGEVSIFASGLKGPTDILKGKDGNFYVSEWNAAQLSKIDQKGNVSKFAATNPGPGPMTLDRDGNIYVTHNVNDGSGYVSKISLEGKVEIFSEGEYLVNPGGIDFDNEGNLYISNFNDANIVKIDKQKHSKIIATVPGNEEWQTGHLKVIDNSIYVTTLMNHRIYKIGFDGIIEVFAGTGEPGNETGTATEVKIKFPNGLFYNSETHELLFSLAFEKTNYLNKIKLKTNN